MVVNLRNVLAGMLFILPATAFSQDTGVLIYDTPTKIGNLEAVCTGVGLEDRQNEAWANYPVRIEIAGRGGQYLGDVHLTLSQKNKTLAAVTCEGPWILFRVPTGRYEVNALTEGETISSTITAPETGQARIILRFPDLGGESGSAPAAKPSS